MKSRSPFSLPLVILLFLASTTLAKKRLAAVPDDNQVYIGAWTDLSTGFDDTPASINSRLGLNFPIFQMGQSIPLPVYNYTTGAGGEALFSYVDDTATNAAYFLTVYPDQTDNLAGVQDSDLVSLAYQILKYQAGGRVVYLRFAPEMGGIWNSYGLQPTLFKTVWQRMYTIIKEIAPETVVVWSPNSSYGYPSGATLADVVSQADKTALDTNGDGNLTAADDAFSPYYPGDDYLDWAGVSLYYKGPGFQNLNQPQPGGFCSHVLLGQDPFYDVNYTSFYPTYCESANRPCILSETGAAYHVNVTGGSSQLAMQQAWWEDCLTNTTFYDLFPQIKSIFMFEHAKEEYDGGVEDYRDYRIMNTSDTISGFQAAVNALGSRLVWANSTITEEDTVDSAVPTIDPSSPVPTATGTLTVTLSGLSSEVVTYTSTGFSTPSGPASTALAGSTGLTLSTAGAATMVTNAINAVSTSGAAQLIPPLQILACSLISVFLLS